jgi:hypothetical protein
MVVRDDRDEIAVVRMAHGKVSALDPAFCQAMAAEIERLEQEPAGALVLTGTGSAFSAGVDLHQLLNGGIDYVRHFLPLMETFFRALLLFKKPLVAAVNGHRRRVHHRGGGRSSCDGERPGPHRRPRAARRRAVPAPAARNDRGAGLAGSASASGLQRPNSACRRRGNDRIRR